MATYKQDHIHLTNPDPVKMAQFYVNIMGARITGEREIPGRKIIELELGGMPLRISNSTGADENWKGLQFGLHHLGLVVDDLDSAVTKMKSAGVEFVIKPYSPRPGVKSMFARTPDGVLFEITEKKDG
ncbi:MAG: hypothetical protein HW402_825 [Dehalococcoidales bacterium]|nr:hypothetical protein [Dehalococcoidales bacterium]